jgi:hypothetical protein
MSMSKPRHELAAGMRCRRLNGLIYPCRIRKKLTTNCKPRKIAWPRGRPRDGTAACDLDSAPMFSPTSETAQTE